MLLLSKLFYCARITHFHSYTVINTIIYGYLLYNMCIFECSAPTFSNPTSFNVVNEKCPPGLSQAKLRWCLHTLNACFPLLDWYLVSKQSCWAGDVLCVDTSLTLRASLSQLGLKQHAEGHFTSPGCNVPTLLDSTLCVWVTVFKTYRPEMRELPIEMSL